MHSKVKCLLLSRLELGKERYTHGVKIDSDTREWKTQNNDWFEMMQEELLDGMIYCAADALRHNGYIRPEDQEDDNHAIMSWINDSIIHVEETGLPQDEHQEILNDLYKSVRLSVSVQKGRNKPTTDKENDS